jgi:hypothetical protein
MSVTFWLVIGIVFLGLLVLYYFLLVRAILEMLRRNANMVMMAFAFLALVPVPPLLILGIVIIIIWHIHKKSLTQV